MCGIAGVRRYGEKQITAEEIKVLLCSLEHRGNHATGIALMSAGEIKIMKAPVPAWAFCAEKETDEFLEAFLPEATMALLHTRFATIGNPSDNENNHPMFMGNSAVVHNGGISNHQYMFDSVIKGERSCATDSDVFRAILDKEGMSKQAIATMSKAAGSAAIAAFSQEDPDKLILARSGSPLVYAATDDKLWWASEIGAIQRAVRPWEKHHGLHVRKFQSDVGYFGMPDNTAYILSGNDLEWRGEFKICTNYRAPAYNMRATYHDKMEDFKKEKQRQKTLALLTAPLQFTHKSTKCPRTDCTCIVVLPKAEKFCDFTCPTCDTDLRALDSLSDKDLMFQMAPPERK